MTEVLITSSVLIAVIALLRAVFKDRIHPGLQYALWGLVLLRLLIPVSWFESPVSVAGAADPILRQVQQYSAENNRTVALPATETGTPAEAEALTEASATIEPPEIARRIWLGGVLILAVWFLFVNLRLARTLARERTLYLQTRNVPVYVTKSLPSPCLYLGAVYLTEEAAADPVRAEYIIAHELTHRRHGDGVWSALRVVCLAVYWFDPLVWLAAALSRQDCELFCDAAAVKTLGEDRRFDYGRTLLDMTAVKIRPGDLICSATTMSGSGKSLRSRIARIARNRKTSVPLAAVVILIAAITVGCTFSGARDAAEPSALMPTPTAESAVSTPTRPADQFYGLPNVKTLPGGEERPLLEESDLGMVGVFWTDHEGPYDVTALLQYLSACTMTPIYWTEDNLALPAADWDIAISTHGGNIYLGVSGAEIAHYAVIQDGEDYIVCSLNNGDSIYADVKAILEGGGEISEPESADESVSTSVSESRSQAASLSVYATAESTPPAMTPTAAPTPSPVAVEAVSATPVITEETDPSPIPDRGTPPDWEEDTSQSDSDPDSTPAPILEEPVSTAVPIADAPENLWGENWRDGLTAEQIALLEAGAEILSDIPEE